MTELEHTQLLHKEKLPAKIGIRDGMAPWFVEDPLKRTAQSMTKTYSLVWTRLKRCMDIGLLLCGSKNIHFQAVH